MPDTAAARILVVDDEAPLMTALCRTLRQQGYETVGFTSGLAALEALHKSRYDLILTDLMMPEMNGIALLRAVAGIDPHLVAIVITGEGTIATAVEAMKAGALDYILKPFRLSIILPVISRALAVRQLRLENAELERRVRSRTAELEAANQELEAFSYSVSHDLRAPLRAVDGFTHILLANYASQMPHEAQQLLKKVSVSAQHMGHLVDDLLRFSRLGRQPLSKRPVNLSSLAHLVLEELREQQGGRQIEVGVGSLPDCQGDPSLLKQVFINLLSNAFKFTRQKELPVIEVGAQQTLGETVYFVRDNGVGFDMQYAQRLFGVFQRFHRPEEYEGTGVGLSIVQRIIQRHGGRIWAESEVGQGATFYFTLSEPPEKRG